MFYPPFITNKIKRFSFKSRCVIRVEIAKCVISYSQRKLSKSQQKSLFYLPFITNKTECISFKCGYVVRMAKHLKGDCCIMLC